MALNKAEKPEDTFRSNHISSPEIEFRVPLATDGLAINRLIADSPPLDTNSLYCNLLQCSYFSDTCLIAELNGKLAGFVSGFLAPNKSGTLFLWQMVVDKSARGRGLALQMICELLSRPSLKAVSFIETTVNPSNKASSAVFEKFAQQAQAQIDRSALFEKNSHFGGDHEDEVLLRIGPFFSRRFTSL